MAKKEDKFVSCPGLVSNPGHKPAKRQMKNGYGGVIAFGVDADEGASSASAWEWRNRRTSLPILIRHCARWAYE